MTSLPLSDGSRLPVPVARNEGVALLYADERYQRLPIPAEIQTRQFLLACINEANKLPRDVVPGTITTAIFNCACLGLIPGSQLGHAWFIPFNVKGQGRVAQLIVGYKGFLELAYGANFLRDVHCQVVLRGEEFEYWVDTNGPQLRHQLPIEREEAFPNVTAAYCVWHSTSGGHGIEVVGRDRLEKLHRRGNVWKSDPIAMSKKTPVRQASKTWKQTRQLGWAVHLDEAAERGESQLLVRPELDQPPEEDAVPPLPPPAQVPLTDDPALEQFILALQSCKTRSAVISVLNASKEEWPKAAAELDRLANARTAELAEPKP